MQVLADRSGIKNTWHYMLRPLCIPGPEGLTCFFSSNPHKRSVSHSVQKFSMFFQSSAVCLSLSSDFVNIFVVNYSLWTHWLVTDVRQKGPDGSAHGWHWASLSSHSGVESGPPLPLLNIYDVFLTDCPPATLCCTCSVQQIKSSLQKANLTQHPTPNL